MAAGENEMKKKILCLNEIRIAGTEALYERLGPVGMVRFLRQFETGEGDYTKEREEWLGSLTLRDIVKEIKR
jgi:hypothetical protein